MYLEHCLNGLEEADTLQTKRYEYHYTLYYYDQAENLVMTVPPEGVYQYQLTTPFTPALNTLINDARKNIGTPYDTKDYYTLKTKYLYNSFGNKYAQQTPDAGNTYFWYDNIGRPVLSQNSKQFVTTSIGGTDVKHYSYTLYDALGRTIEVGQIAKEVPVSEPPADYNAFITSYIESEPDAYRTEVTHTYYDDYPFSAGISGFTAENLRNRVAATTYEDVYDSDVNTYQTATHYSYDIAGNVKTLVQENRALAVLHQQYKRVDYNYDLISGKVNAVYYQPNRQDKFYHKYDYDADNRITAARTSNDGGITYKTDASYQYYRHGPLAREVIGELQVQGVDYAYTLQGWLKVINSTTRDTAYDMGEDGRAVNSFVARDAYGMSLGYFDNSGASGFKDYNPIGAGVANEADYSSSTFGGASASLYDGNVRHIGLSLAGLNSSPTIGYAYAYDQLGRLMKMETHTAITTNAWMSSAATHDYDINMRYNENGGIVHNIRYAHNGTTPHINMDSLSYKYISGTNRLDTVMEDDPGNTNNFTTDIDGINTYSYTPIGEKSREEQGDGTVLNYSWNSYGKLKQVTKNNGDTLTYAYDPLNNLTSETAKTTTGTATTYYINDAEGHIMAAYYLDSNGDFYLNERDIYGSKRLGVDRPDLLMTASSRGSCGFSVDSFLIGKRFYELTNHQGSVMVTVSDKKIGVDANNDGAYDFYDADLASVNDYYAGGMLMPNRTLSYSDYSFGYQGQLQLNAVQGKGNFYRYKYRMSDPRLGGEFLTNDPLFKDYPGWTPYGFSQRRYIDAIEFEGLEKVLVFDKEERPKDNGTSGTSYTANVLVIDKAGKVQGPYKGSSYPNSISPTNNNTNSNTINTTTVPYNNKFGHKGGTQKGLNIVNDKGERKTLGTDPQGKGIQMINVNFHEGKSDNGNYNSRGSEGCLTISPNDANNFFDNFDWNSNKEKTKGQSEGTISIYRGGESAIKIQESLGILQERQKVNIPVGFDSEIEGAPLKK